MKWHAFCEPLCHQPIMLPEATSVSLLRDRLSLAINLQEVFRKGQRSSLVALSVHILSPTKQYPKASALPLVIGHEVIL